MSIAAPITVTTSATRILAATDNPHGAGAPGMVVVQNTGSVALTLGPDADVVATGSITIPAGTSLGLSLVAGRELYGIVASSTTTVRVEVF